MRRLIIPILILLGLPQFTLAEPFILPTANRHLFVPGEGELFFVGYGITSEEDKYDEYADLDFATSGSDIVISSTLNSTFTIVVQNRALTDLDDATHFLFG